MKFAIIGGGLTGMGTALELKRLDPRAEAEVFEKETGTGRHQSTHNSGVLHAGLYYQPGSLKAELAVRGIRRMVAFCQEHGVAHEICGKVVVATEEAEIPRLRTLLERGNQTGLQGLRWLVPDELREIEPNAAGIAAVRVPEEGIVDFAGVCQAMEAQLRRDGVAVRTGTQVGRINPEGGGWRLETTAGDFQADFIINCAGLQSDRVAAAAGEKRSARIVPFRGEYFELRPEARSLVRHLIYPVPDPSFPFLGVQFTRKIGGGVEAGPNAVLALAREGYSKWKIHPRDVADAVLFQGLWRFLGQHRKMVWQEIERSFSKARFCQALQRAGPGGEAGRPRLRRGGGPGPSDAPGWDPAAGFSHPGKAAGPASSQRPQPRRHRLPRHRRIRLAQGARPGRFHRRMKPAIIEVENLSKRYRLGSIGATTLREAWSARWERLRSGKTAASRVAALNSPGESGKEFWALRDVSFTVQPGEVVGIIGRNGAGKSTLLKILSRVTEPSGGRARLRGRLASLCGGRHRISSRF